MDSFVGHPRRSRVGLFCLLLLLVMGCAAPSSQEGVRVDRSDEPANYAFTNGRWFDGQGFAPATWYSAGGLLTRMRPAGRLEIVDLDGAFVVPPFAEAHNHNVEGAWNIETVIRRYLQDGVFYVKIPGNIAAFTDTIRPRLNRPSSIDVVFSNGGLTATGGHPAPLYDQVLAVTRYGSVVNPAEKDWFNNRAYYLIDHDADLQNKWNRILQTKPDFLKTYLAHSETFGRPAAGHPDRHAGLDPVLLPRIVTKAHAAGLRVSTHVETATDFRNAVRAGVDEITHLPGWLVTDMEDVGAARLTEEDAQRAASAGVVVVTTTVAGQRLPGHADAEGSEHGHGHASGTMHAPAPHAPTHGSSDSAAVREVQRENLQLLSRHGVRLAVGSDHADTSVAEAMNLHALQVFDNLALLKLWCEATAEAIFPGRRIGHLKEGYEASFLALSGNPIEEFAHVQRIRLRVKQGRLLEL